MIFKIMIADLYRIFHSKSFYISFFVCIFIVLITDIFGFEFIIFSRAEYPPVLNIDGGAYRVYFFLSTALNYLFLLIPFYIMLYCKDFSNKIIYNHIANGVKRTDYYVSKLLSMSFINAIVYVFTNIIALVICSLIFGFGLQEDISDYLTRFLNMAIIHILLLNMIGKIYFTLEMIIQNTIAWVLSYIFSIIILGSLFITSEVKEIPLLRARLFPQYWFLSSVNNQFYNLNDYKQLICFLLICNFITVLIGLLFFNKRDIKC